jgi:hypothetical protein
MAQRKHIRKVCIYLILQIPDDITCPKLSRAFKKLKHHQKMPENDQEILGREKTQ